MKKTITGIFALVAAFTLYAFTVKSPSPDKSVEKELSTELIWYQVNSAGVIPNAGSLMYGGVKRDKAFAQTNSPCSPGSTSDCLRGFTNAIPPGAFPNYAGVGSDQVKKP